jgi:Domain of unknown function (DUF4345)
VNPRRHRIAVQVFLVFNSLFWLPWGIVCLLFPKAWAGDVIAGMDVYDLSGAVARTEVRAMYGGLQMAIGVFALIGAFRPRHRDTVFLLFVLALTGLAVCRFAGMVAEGDGSYLRFALDIAPGTYNQVGLAMYELPNMVFAWALFLLRPRRSEDAPTGLDALASENARLRAELETIRLEAPAPPA